MPNYYRFRKRKKNQEDDIDIFLRQSYAEILPKNYIVDERLLNFTKALDQHLKKLLPSCLDQITGGCLDTLITQVYKQAIQHLIDQRASHNWLLSVLDVKTAEDMKDIKFKIEEIQQELRTIDDKLSVIAVPDPFLYGNIQSSDNTLESEEERKHVR